MKLLKTPGPPRKSPQNALDDLTGVSDLISTPEPLVVARAAIAVPTSPEEPSTSKAGKGKRKALEDSVSASSVKKAKVENEATTSSMSRSSSVRGRGAASPSKTSRGGKGSPKMEIPKFSLDAADDSTTDSEVEVEKKQAKEPWRF